MLPQDRQLAATIDRLATGDVYERLLAIQSCYGSRDGERVVRACTDRSRLIRGRARKLLPVVGNDEQVLAILTAASYQHRRYLLKFLVKRRRHLTEIFSTSESGGFIPRLDGLM